MGLFQKSDPNTLRILAQVGILNQKVDQLVTQIMSSNNSLAVLSKQIIGDVQQLKTELDSQTTDVNQSLNNFKAWLAGEQAASTVDATTLSDLQAAASLLSGFHTVVQSIDSAAKSADPGAPPASPVNG